MRRLVGWPRAVLPHLRAGPCVGEAQAGFKVEGAIIIISRIGLDWIPRENDLPFGEEVNEGI
jgi:hypothetical protein